MSLLFESTSTVNQSLPDPLESLKRDLTGVQIEIWLLEERQRVVHQLLRNRRTFRAALGRQYRRLMPVNH